MDDKDDSLTLSKAYNLGNLSKLSPLRPTVDYLDFSHLEEAMEEINRDKEEKEQRDLEYKESVLNSLHGIEKNTALLTEMTLLLQRSNDKQDEIFKLIVEIMEIMKSTDKEEAESKYRTVMKKIGEFTGDFSTVQSLYGMGQAVFNAYQSLPL